ncbi:diacylglycerol/lipid kinase family protein [Spirosoma utsteinense]|uniref:YegS/Rv2252/BmrU family lipid kinase n=1 Tax=Spirosoma utsteinense TaxID=2585773 RepID=A0ABR6W856_9BACT|nr:diacylglycerol kinase family protein [Spirosoma utsteinense]MBC3792750.1 YegS/Rv2252/BmrU family lipid kinase [Spirosoma utsteinense]
MTFLFAINPVSGGKGKTDWTMGIKNYFANSTHVAELRYLDGKTDAQIVSQAIDELKPDRVVAVGGDGTLKIVAEQLVDTGIPLGILPAGSANGMARELGIPAAIQESLDVVVNGKLKAVDLIAINDNDICLHLSDIGLNAQVVRYYEKNNWRGMFGYFRSVLKTLRKRRQLRVEIDTGEECIQRIAFMIVLANARMYGTGAVINPDGDLSDGRFEVVIFRRMHLWGIIKLFWRYRPFDPKYIEIIPATSVTIETHRRAYFQIDGEYRGRITRLDARIRPGAVTMLVPPDVSM